MQRRAVLLLGVVLVFVMAACAPKAQQPAAPEKTNIKFGILPILEVVPLYVAEQEGFFEKEGLNVELVLVKGAQERDALMQAGEIDGMWTDLVAVGLFNRDGPQIDVVATGFGSNPDLAMFRILAAPGSGLEKPEDLVDVPIGLSQNTVAQYLTERMLTGEGLAPEQIAIIEVSAIPVRFEQLMAGQIKAAALPDPLALGAMSSGATLIVDDRQYPQYSQSNIVFAKSMVDSSPETVRSFLKAWDEAVAALNKNPEAYRELLLEKGRVPDSIRDSYVVPKYPTRRLPTELEWQDVNEWMISKGLLDEQLPYEKSIVTEFYDAEAE